MWNFLFNSSNIILLWPLFRQCASPNFYTTGSWWSQTFPPTLPGVKQKMFAHPQYTYLLPFPLCGAPFHWPGGQGPCFFRVYLGFMDTGLGLLLCREGLKCDWWKTGIFHFAFTVNHKYGLKMCVRCEIKRPWNFCARSFCGEKLMWKLSKVAGPI